MSDNASESKRGEGMLISSLGEIFSFRDRFFLTYPYVQDAGWIENPNVFSQICIVDEIMHAYEFEQDLPEDSVKAHELFDMIIGTGSGGLLAAMLGPLKMTTKEALVAFHDFRQAVFDELEMLSSQSLVQDKESLALKLTTAVEALIEQRFVTSPAWSDLPLLSAITAMTSVHVATPTVFRGYRSRSGSPNCTLIDALRATMASARLFPSVACGEPILQRYIGDDAGHANPINTVLQEAATVFRNKSIAAILSIGCGKYEIISVEAADDFPEAMVKLASSAHAESERTLSRFSHHPEAYQRFNVDHLHPPTIALHATVEAACRAYLAREDTILKLDSLLLLLRSRPSTIEVNEIGHAKPGALAQEVKRIPIVNSIYDNLKMLSYAERASFNPELVCLEGTRTHILQMVFTWMLEKRPKPPVVLVEGLLGSGKSFIAHSVAVEAYRLRILGSSFFMTPGTNFRKVEGSNSASQEPPSLKNIVTSLIIDLGGLSDQFRWSVGELLSKQPLLATANPSVQLTDLLLPTLASLPNNRTFVWVIDGFDEVLRYSDDDETDQFFHKFCSLFAALPSNFLLFITSRPLPNRPLPDGPNIQHIVLDLASPENDHDLDLIADFPLPSRGGPLVVAFRRKAEGHPLWLRVVREHLRRSVAPREELEELLNLNGNISSDYDQLMTPTYTQVITRSIDLENAKNQKALRHVVLVLLALQRPLSRETLLEILEGSEDIPSETFESVTFRLRSLLIGFDSSAPLEFIHLSLRDFFTSSSSFGHLVQDMTIPRDLVPGHFTLLRSAFRVMEMHLDPEKPVENYPQDHPPLGYVVGSWPNHMTCLDPAAYKLRLAGPLSIFLDRSFMAWLVYHATIGLPFLFTEHFLERAKSFVHDLWIEKVVSQRQVALKLDELREQFEKEQRFNDWVLCSNQAVEVWRHQVHRLQSDYRYLFVSIEHKARGLDRLGLKRAALTSSEEALNIYNEQKEYHEFDQADLPWLMNGLSYRLADTGQHLEALNAAREAVRLYMQLVQDRPNTFEAVFAESLNNFANRLNDTGQHGAALAASQIAMSLRQQQVLYKHSHPLAADLANSLANLSAHLSLAGRNKEALTASREAVSIYKQLEQEHPIDYTGDLARSLTNMSVCLIAVGLHVEALNATEEAMPLMRRLVQDRPTVFTDDLAVLLTNFSNRLSEAGRHAEALSASEEAVSLQRQLARQRPNPSEATLALSLYNHSNHLSAARHADSALAASREAVLLYKRLVRDRPQIFEAQLAHSLTNFTTLLSAAGRPAEALTAIGEAVALFKSLVHDQPYEAELATSLITYSHHLLDAGRAPDSLAAMKEAVSLRRSLMNNKGNAFALEFAGSLVHFSNRLSDVGRNTEALSIIEEAVSVYRKLMHAGSNDTVASLAGSLNNLSNRLSDAGQHSASLSAIEESVSLYQKLVKDSPKVFEADLARSLNSLSNSLSNIGRKAEALNVNEQAASLPTTAANFSIDLSDAGRHEQALSVIEEAVSLYRQLVTKHPNELEAALARSLLLLSSCLAQTKIIVEFDDESQNFGIFQRAWT
ncbi:hypothetical protein DL96DRAFT_1716040 [Flagelloscypha sp. PMI_526]|nr:hypothetical protein DL96DRAFT_1716040 [Flagelloscypha sp. PMI_526]